MKKQTYLVSIISKIAILAITAFALLYFLAGIILKDDKMVTVNADGAPTPTAMQCSVSGSAKDFYPVFDASNPLPSGVKFYTSTNGTTFTEIANVSSMADIKTALDSTGTSTLYYTNTSTSAIKAIATINVSWNDTFDSSVSSGIVDDVSNTFKSNYFSNTAYADNDCDLWDGNTGAVGAPSVNGVAYNDIYNAYGSNNLADTVWSSSAKTPTTAYYYDTSYNMWAYDMRSNNNNGVCLVNDFGQTPVSYTLNYDLNGGSGTVPTDSTIYSAGAVVSSLASTNGITKTGYAIIGWALTSDATEALSSYTINDDDATAGVITLYAVWKKTYTITYSNSTWTADWDGDINRAFNQGDILNIVFNIEIGLEIINYSINGSSNPVSYSNTTTYTFSESICSVYTSGKAIYITDLPLTITYNLNGAEGTAPTDSTNYKVGDNVEFAEIGSITRTGYIFFGWALTSDATEALSSYSVVLSDANSSTGVITLYAVWKEGKTVTYDYTEWTGDLNATFNQGDLLNIVINIDEDLLGNANIYTVANKSNYAWYSSVSYIYEFSGSVCSISASGDTLSITDLPITVAYDLNGGSSLIDIQDGKSYSVGDSVTFASTNGLNVNKSGYSFLGWALTSDATEALSSYSVVLSDANSSTGVITFYAVWESLEYTKDVYLTITELEYGLKNSDIEITVSDNTLRVVGYTIAKASYAYDDSVGVKADGEYNIIIFLEGNGVDYWFRNNPEGDYTYDAYATNYEVFSYGSQDYELDYYFNPTPANPILQKYLFIRAEILLDSYHITYDKNTTDTVTYMPTTSAQYLPNDLADVEVNMIPYREGYEWIGWNTDKDASAGLTFTDNKVQMVEDGITLYAIWRKIIVTEPSKDNDYEVIIDSAITDATYQWYKSKESESLLSNYEVCDDEGTNEDTCDFLFNLGTYDSTNNQITFDTNSNNIMVGFQNDCANANYLKFKCSSDTTFVNVLSETTVIKNGEYYYAEITDWMNFRIRAVNSGSTAAVITDISVCLVETTELTGETNAKFGTTELEDANYYCVVSMTGGVRATSTTLNPQLISFDGNGEDSGSIASVYQFEGRTITLPSTGFTKIGYNLVKWNTEEDGSGTEYDAGSTYTVGSSDVTLYAIYEKATYTITYYLNYGTNNENNPATYQIDTETITLADASKIGRVFKGWYDNASFTGDAITEIAKGSTGNIDLYAKFEDYCADGDINVTFSDEFSYGYGLSAEDLVDAATIDNNKFEIEGALIAVLDGDEGVKVESITTPGTYCIIVVFKAVDGRWVKSVHDDDNYAWTIMIGTETANVIAICSNFDYDELSPQGGTSFTQMVKMVVMYEMTLTGHTLTYDDNVDGQVIEVPTDSNTYLEGQPVTLSSSVPTRTGYRFVGWNTDPSATSALTTYAMGDSDATLYAIWGLGYIDENGNAQEVTSFEMIESTSTTLTSGWYAAEGDVTVASRITCTGDVKIILVDGCKFIANSGITVSGDDNSLTIYGQVGQSGELEATGRSYNAAIGGEGNSTSSPNRNGENITINGGVIKATASDHGAGIGGSIYGEGNHITINGGTVTATGKGWGSGIGGGDRGSGNYITINGGNVTAIGSAQAAGIGGGSECGASYITITGGTVTATTAYYGAAIGSGCGGNVDYITISGGTVTATGDTKGAGIGAGLHGTASNITISNGNVTATGGQYAAGIGTSDGKDVTNITISGGTIIATGGQNAAGIGGGNSGDATNITISGGNITAQAGYLAAAIGGGEYGEATNITITGGTITANGGMNNTIAIGAGYSKTATGIYVADAMVIKAGAKANPTEVIGHGSITTDITSSLAGKLYATLEVGYVISFDDGVTDDSVTNMPSTTSVEVGGTYTLTESVPTRSNYVFTGWSDGTNTYAAGTLYTQNATNDVTFTAQWAEISYKLVYDLNGAEGTAPIDNTNYDEDDNAELAEIGSITKTGYVFIGWSTNKDDITGSLTTYIVNKDDADENYNITLYAIWQKVLTDNTIDVTVIYNGTNFATLSQIDACIILSGFNANDTKDLATKYFKFSSNGVYQLSSELDWNNVEAKTAGTYTVYYKYEFDNYANVEGSFTLTINKATATIDTTNVVKSYTYDGNEIEVKDGATIDNDVQTLVYTNNKFTNANTYTVTISAAETANYNATSTTVEVVVNKATATIDTTNIVKTYTYGGNEIEVKDGATINNDDQTLVYTNNKFTNANTYTVTISAAETANYNAVSTTVEVVVNKATATIDTTNVVKTYTYDENEIEVNAGATLNHNETELTYTNNKFTNANTYTVTISASETANYNAVSITVEIVVNKAQTVLTVDQSTITKTYGETIVLPTASSNFGNVKCDKKASDLVNAGTYTVTYTVASTENFDGDSKSLTVVINKAQSVITVDETPIVVIYGETVALPIASTNFGTVSCDKTASDLVNAGTYTVMYTVADTLNYTGTTKSITVTINKKAVAEPTVVGTYTFNDKAQTVVLNGVESFMSTTDSLSQTNAGEYSVVYTLDANHEWNSTSDGLVTWTIAKKAVAEPTIVGTYKYDGEAQAVVLDGVESYMTTVSDLIKTEAGTYEIVYTLDNNHEWDSNSDGIVIWTINSSTIKPVEDNQTEGEEESDKPQVIVETEEGFDPTVTVEVEVTVETEILEATELEELTVDYYNIENEDVKLENNEKVGVVFDVKLYRTVDGNKQEIQPSDLDGVTTIKVRMLIPENVDISKVTRILHVHSEDDIEVIEFDASKVVDGYYEIEIDRLSEFAFIYKKATLPVWALIVIIFLVLIIIFLVLFVFWKKEFDKTEEDKMDERKLKFLDFIYRPINKLLFGGKQVQEE